MSTFGDFYNNVHDLDNRLAALGYSLSVTAVELPSKPITASLDSLAEAFARRFPNVSLVNETARREFYVSPILMAALDQAHFRIFYEYPVSYNGLQGTLDYLLRGQHNLVVIEAKNADMERGFAQLAAEMIAVDKTLNESGIVYGAVTTGDLWRFGLLDRAAQEIKKDATLYVVPQNLPEITSFLIGILSTE